MNHAFKSSTLPRFRRAGSLVKLTLIALGLAVPGTYLVRGVNDARRAARRSQVT